MGWFFRKRDVDRSEFETLINSVKESFSNVKDDVLSISSKAKQNEAAVEGIKNTLDYLNQSISLLDKKIDSLEFRVRKPPLKQKNIISEDEQEDLQEEIENSPISETKLSSLQRQWDDLTNVQKSLVIRLKQLQDEENQEFVSMKTLARELYSSTNYSDIKAMISNYTDLLFEQGFIEKTRRRRESFLKLTKKAEPFVPKKKISLKAKNKQQNF